MDLNYDQFNGDTLIFKYNLDEYGNPISIKVDKEEKQVSVHGTIQLEYVPDEYNRVVMLNEDNAQMTEVFNRDEIKPNTYYIDYNNGVAYLDKSQFGKTKIYNYYKKGLQLIGCSRIYDEHDISGKHVVLTLQEIIDAGREALRFLLDIGDAKKVIELLESLIAEGKLTITNLENKKNECIQAIDNAVSQAVQDKNEIVQEIQDNIQQAKDEVVNVAGNKEVIIRASDWALNIDVYEKEISHNLNSENLHVTAKNSDTKEAVTIGYKILDKTRILLKSDEAINMSVILSASYYHATQTISDNIAEEVVKARKGETGLDVKIAKIDEQLDKKTSELDKKKVNIDETYLKANGININDFDEETRRTFLEAQGIDINYVLGKGNVKNENLSNKIINVSNLSDSLFELSDYVCEVTSSLAQSHIYFCYDVDGLRISENETVDISYDIEMDSLTNVEMCVKASSHATSTLPTGYGDDVYTNYDKKIVYAKTSNSFNMSYTIPANKKYFKLYITANDVGGRNIEFKIKNLRLKIGERNVNSTLNRVELYNFEGQIITNKVSTKGESLISSEFFNKEVGILKNRNYKKSYNFSANNTKDMIHAYFAYYVDGEILKNGDTIEINYNIKFNNADINSAKSCCCLLSYHNSSINADSHNTDVQTKHNLIKVNTKNSIKFNLNYTIPANAKYVKIYPTFLYLTTIGELFNFTIEDISLFKNGKEIFTTPYVSMMNYENCIISETEGNNSRFVEIKEVEEIISNYNIINSKYFNKKANFLGDSITAGVNTTRIYASYLRERLGLQLIRNYGINGSSISNKSSSMAQRCLEMDNDSDVNFVFGGTNDFNGNVPLGEFYTIKNGVREFSYDNTTFKGALNLLFKNMKEKYIGKEIIFLTPIHRELYPGQPTELEPNAIGVYFDEYVNATIEACKIWSVKCIDLYSKCGLQPNLPIHKATYFSEEDGLHPNKEGHREIAECIIGDL